MGLEQGGGDLGSCLRHFGAGGRVGRPSMVCRNEATFKGLLGLPDFLSASEQWEVTERLKAGGGDWRCLNHISILKDPSGCSAKVSEGDFCFISRARIQLLEAEAGVAQPNVGLNPSFLLHFQHGLGQTSISDSQFPPI